MLNQIVDVMNEIRKEYPIIGNELDGKIYYMNGNDGTDFDWKCNERVCEFMVFHENEMGYIKLMLYKDGEITVYVYRDGGMHPTDTIENIRYKGNTKAFAIHLYEVFDDNDLYDEAIEDYMDVKTYGYHAYMFEDEWEDEEW